MMTRKKLSMEEFCTECASEKARTEYVVTGGRTEWPDTCAKCSFDTPPTGFTPKPAPTPEPVVDHCSPELAAQLRDAGLLRGHVWHLGDRLWHHDFGREHVFIRQEKDTEGKWLVCVSEGTSELLYQRERNCLYLPSTAWLLAAVRARTRGEMPIQLWAHAAKAWGTQETIIVQNGYGDTDPDRLADLLLKLAKEGAG